MSQFKFRWVIEGNSDSDQWGDIIEFQDWCEDVVDVSTDTPEEVADILDCCDWKITKSEKLD